MSTDVSNAFRISLKHLPISFLLILLTAQISLKVRGTPSCLPKREKIDGQITKACEWEV